MTQAEFVRASLKLIGIGCFIIGFDICSTAVAQVAAIGFGGVPFGFAQPILLAALSRPVAYFVAAFLLIFKTQWCENQFKLITPRAIHSQDST